MLLIVGEDKGFSENSLKKIRKKKYMWFRQLEERD